MTTLEHLVEPSPPNVPLGAYRLHSWQLDVWERQQKSHPTWLTFRVWRGDLGCFDGYVYGEELAATAYICGWLVGRESLDRGI